MNGTIAAAILLPFLGTTLGAGTALFCRSRLPEHYHRACSGFAAGVMTAASVWSLLIPALEQAVKAGPLCVGSALGGFFGGVIAMIGTEKAAARLYRRRNRGALSGTMFMVLAVTLHNVPEGLAVGVACAGLARQADGVAAAGVMALSLGVALQNIPEGAIISLPLRAQGKRKMKACAYGILSGAVEPVAACAALTAAAPISRLMPFFLSLAAGAMLYVTVQELIPEAVTERSRLGSAAFAAGFLLMMTMDVLL